MPKQYTASVFILCISLSAAIVGSMAHANQPIACGKEWINLHKKNPDLIGVYVQQYPDNKADVAKYKSKHPTMVIYVFKNRKAHQVSYTPTGQVEDGFWWDIPKDHSINSRLSTDFKESIFCAFWVKS
jgi:hypothetical protein